MTAAFLSNFTDKPDDPSDISKHAKIALAIFVYGAPIVFVFGLVGNTLTIVIFNRKSLRNTSYSWLFTCLAIADSAYLCTGLVRRWIIFYNSYDLRVVNWLVCAFHYFLTYTFAQLSPWMLILITIERCVSVVAPMRAKIICSRKRMVFASFFSIIVILLVNGHLVYGFRIVPPFGCEQRDDAYLDFWIDYWVHVELCLTTVGPFLILIVCNGIIIISIKRSQLRQAKMMSITATSGKSATRKNIKIESITVMLLTTNFVFILTSLPFSVYLQLPTYENELVDACLSLLSYVNHGINFWLYCFTGQRFRKELYAMFRCCTKASTRPSTSPTNDTRLPPAAQRF